MSLSIETRKSVRGYLLVGLLVTVLGLEVFSPLTAVYAASGSTGTSNLGDPFVSLRSDTTLAADSYTSATAQGTIVESESLADGAHIDVPKLSQTGVNLTNADGSKVNISLPNANSDSAAQAITPGVVGYAGNDGSSNAVQLVKDGSLRMLTVISSASAPTVYTYGVQVLGGGHIVLSSDGTEAQVLNTSGKVVATAQAPWAKDALGHSIATYYTTDGASLTQHIEHHTAQVSYPVTADPWWAPSRIDHVTWVSTAWGASMHVYVTWYGYLTSFLFPHDAYSEAIQDGNTGWSNAMYNQFVCHADFAPPWKESWNLDTWRPDVGLWTTILRKCNP